MQVNMHEAKSQLSKLAEKVWQGEKVIIAKAGKPYLELLPVKQDIPVRKAGRYQQDIQIAADFDEISEDVIALFRQASDSDELLK